MAKNTHEIIQVSGAEAARQLGLSTTEFEKFQSSREYMPAWMSNAVLQYTNKKEIERT